MSKSHLPSAARRRGLTGPGRAARTAAAIATAACLSFGLAACSSDEAGSDSSTNSASGESAANDADAAQFPTTVTHAFGETTIEHAPQRVATVGWSNQEVPLALGIVPVGMAKVTWGDDDNDGMMPWVKDKIDELGGEQPALFDETDGIPFEQVADTQPDVILAAYSGLTREDYETLSKIAPVVAYPDIPWATSLEDMVTLNSQALGKPDQGRELLEDLESQVDAALEKYPKLGGTKPLFTAFGGASDKSKIGFYTTGDTRMGFLVDHGFEAPQIVKDHSENTESFWEEVSAENPEQFEDVDFLIAYSSGNADEDAKAIEDMQKDPLLSKIPAVRDGRIALLPDGPLGAAANESPLALPQTIDDYFRILNDAVED